MEGRLFTFLGAIGGHGQEWIILSHYILVLGIIFLIARAATRKLQLVPTGAQNVMETFVGGIIKMGTDTMGEQNARTYMPLIASLAIVIFVSNMMGVIPGFEAPTSNINFTLSLALIVFVYYNYLKGLPNVYRKITFMTKAEDKNLAVACASLISRFIFVK